MPDWPGLLHKYLGALVDLMNFVQSVIAVFDVTFLLSWGRGQVVALFNCEEVVHHQHRNWNIRN